MNLFELAFVRLFW